MWRLDWQGGNDHVFASFWHQRAPVKLYSQLPQEIATETLSDPQNSWVNRFNYDKILTPTLLNHMSMGYLNRNEGYGCVNQDFVGDFPQTSERSSGFGAFWAELQSYPGGAPESDIPEMRLLGDDERWAISPGYSVVPLADPRNFTVVGSAIYPDGLRWHIIMSVELRDGRLYRAESYFAPEMGAPLAAAIAVYPHG